MHFPILFNSIQVDLVTNHGKHKLCCNLNKLLQCFSVDKGKHSPHTTRCCRMETQQDAGHAASGIVHHCYCNFSFEPIKSNRLIIYLTPSSHTYTNTHTSSGPSKHSNRYPDYPQRTALIMTLAVGMRKRKTASEGGQDVSIGKSIKKRRL